jgi:hypothetical protein
MSANTKDILVEITSTVGMDICKKVMEEMIVEMINMGITSSTLEEKLEAVSLNKDTNDASATTSSTSSSSSSSSEEDDPNSKLRRTLLMQQVKIVDSKGNLKTVYPSRVDLNFGDSNKLRVKRLYDD